MEEAQKEVDEYLSDKEVRACRIWRWMVVFLDCESVLDFDLMLGLVYPILVN